MASSLESSSTTNPTKEEGPVMSLITKRLRALRKKLNRIHQLEDSISQGKPINKEQEEFLKSKPSVLASIDELDKLRLPLSSALSEELSLLQKSEQPTSRKPENYDAILEDLLNLLYFGSLFDVKSQGEFRAIMFTRTHERGCCLTYDYVTDDETDLLREKDLDLISGLSNLLVSRPVDSGLSHTNALKRCVERAKLWLANSDLLVDPNFNVSYAGLRAKLNKIMASDYFTTTPEMKGPVEVAAAAAGNYASFQVPVHGVPDSVPVQVDGSDVGHFQQEEEEMAENFQGHESSDHSIPAEELQKDEGDNGNHGEDFSAEQESVKQAAEVDHNQGELEPKEQHHNSRRNYQNHRGIRGGGGGGARRGYPNGRGGRFGSRGYGGYQNDRNQFYDQPGNHYPRSYYNNRGRGGRGGGHHYNSNGSVVQAGHASAGVGVTS